jgi:hypothetical protein
LLLKAIEMFLEVFSMGFSLWRVLVQDFEVVSVADHPYYPSHLLVEEIIDVRPEIGVAANRVYAEHSDGDKRGVVKPRGLRLSLQEVTDELRRQVQLRHSAYYEDKGILTRVAEFLTDGGVRETESTRPVTMAPSAKFWEVLLVANVALLAICLWILGPELTHVALLVQCFIMLGYVLPFTFLGIGLACYFAIWRRMPARIWPWFWIPWVICMLGEILIAFGTRRGLL